MIIFKEAAALTQWVLAQKDKDHKIGFVPTMGALHQGHISLIKQSIEETDVTISSIFVNPTQFNDPKDFDRYPVTISRDIYLLQQSGCNVLFLPSVNEIYPNGLKPDMQYHLGELEKLLEGKYRPNHFQGVCQVVHRLLEIVNPHILFLGQKDYQQYLVIKHLVQLLGMTVQVNMTVTHREATGLAMSSRNIRLSDDDKISATAIFNMLTHIGVHRQTQEPRELERYATEHLLTHGFSKVDYISIADARTLQPITSASDTNNAIALIAANIGEVRLIDNMLWGQTKQL